MRVWLKRSGDLHIPAIKTFAYAKVNAALVVKTPEETARYRRLQKDPDLLAFHAKHDLPGSSFSGDDIARASGLLREALGEMDRNIQARGFIVGGAYSLADISWAPTITTLRRAGFPFDEFSHVMGWYDRIELRPAWQRAMTQWQSGAKQRIMAMRAE